MSVIKTFNSNVYGKYPLETYVTKIFTDFIDLNGVSQTLATGYERKPYRSHIRYQKRPTNQILDYLDSGSYDPLFTYTNAICSLNLGVGDNDNITSFP